MRLPWFSQRHSQRSATRRKRAAPLKVRRLERRRVLDAAVTDLVFAPADLDPSTAAHDVGEGTPINVSSNATGNGALVYDWTLTQNGNTVKQGSDPTFNFTQFDEGNFSLTLTVTDQGGEGTVASRTEDIVIHNVRPVLILTMDQQVEEGETLNLIAPQLGLFVDPGILDDRIATIDWGDGSPSEDAAQLRNPPATGLGGTHTYTAEGKYKVTVSVNDGDGGVDTKSFFVTVVNAAPTATLSNDGPVEEGSTATATVTFTNQFDPNPADAAAGFRYAYDFDNDGTFEVGDGTYAGSVTSASESVPAAFFAEGPGSHTVRARIIDLDDGFTDYTTTITIDNVAPQLANLAAVDNSIDEGQSATIQMNIVDPSASDVFSVEVDWKDGDSADTITGLGFGNVSGTVGSTTYQWDAETRQLTVTHLYKDDNPTTTTSDTYAVALVVRDDDLGTSDPYNVNITVSNVQPVMNEADNQTVNEGALLNLTGVGGAALAVYVDLGIEDTHTATVDWGDGSASEAPTIFAAPGFGTLGASHTYAENGTYTVTVALTDDDGLTDTRTFTVTVLNVAPSIVTLAITSPINEGQSATLTGTYSDPGSLDTHELDIDWDDNGTFDQTITVSGGMFSVSRLYPDDNPTGTPSDTFNVNVRLRDDDAAADTGAVSLTVNNVRPVMNEADNQTVNEGELLNLTGVGGTALAVYVDLGVEDTFAATVDWGDGSASEAPTIFAAPGFGTLGASHTYAENGTYTATLTLTDDDGLTDIRTFEVTVLNVAPSIDTLAISTPINEGQSATLTGTYSDPGSLDTHELDIDWDGNGTFDQTVTVSGGSFSVSHLYPDDNPTGTPSDTFNVNIRLRDDDGDDDTGAVALTVNNVRPVMNEADNQTVNEGALLNLTGVGGTALAVYVDLGVEDTHTATVDWGDGSASEAPTIFAAPGFGALGASHTYAENGTYTVTLTLTDDDGGVDTRTFIVTVLNVAPTIDTLAITSPINEGQSATLTGTYSDPGVLDTHELDVDWDGNGTFDQTITVTGGSFSVSRLYPDDNPTGTPFDTFNVNVQLRDDDGDADTGSVALTVNNVRPVINVAANQTINEGELLNLTGVGGTALAVFVDPGVEDTFTATVNWGDGSAIEAPAIFAAPGFGTLGASHTYADNGAYTVTVMLTDDDGQSDTKTFTVTVLNVVPTLEVTPSSITVDEGAEVTFDATFSDPGFDNPDRPGGATSESFRYFVDWGDGRDQVPDSPVADIDGGPMVPSTGMFDGSHIYADNGMYTVTVRIADDDMSGNFATGVAGVDFVEQTFTVTVNNVAPTPEVTPTATSITEGSTTGFTATFTDPGFDNPANPAGPTSETFRYFVDWGDGRDQVPDSPVTDRTSGGPLVPTTGAFSGSHTYADDGVYTVTIRIADDDMTGNFADGVAGVDFVERTFTVTVVNVPPSLTGTTNVMVDEGSAFTLTGLNVGLEDFGFDNPLNPTTPALGDPFQETFRVVDINWGDGSAATPVTIDNDLDRTSGSPGVTTKALFTHAAHTYADDGVYTVTIRVADDNMLGDFSGEAGDDNIVVLTFQITVENVPPTLTPSANLTIAESEDLVIPVLGSFTDPGFDNPLNPTTPATGLRFNESFAYYLDWGDGRDQIGTLGVSDTDGAPGTLSSGNFDGTHNYADNGTYTVTIRLADDNMGAFADSDLFQNGSEGVAGVDYVERTFVVTVTNVAPAFTPQLNGENLAAPDLDQNGMTTIFVSYNDPGYDNPLNPLASLPDNGDELVETFNHVIQWGDGMVDAVHQYTTAGAFTVTVTVTGPGDTSLPIEFPNISSINPVVNLVSTQQLNDPTVVPQLYSFEVNWGDDHVETFTLSLLNPGVPAGFTGLTNLVTSARTSGNALTNTTGLAAIQHQYLGPPNPLNPTADIVITLSVYDDDGDFVTDTIAVGNPGIQTTMVAIDTTPDVARLDLTTQPVTVGFVADQGGLAQLFQVPDVRGGGGETAATTERYLELRIVYPDGTESEGFKIQDEALADLRAFFKTLPDGRYRIYLIRTENRSERLVIEVDVRRGRVIDVTDDSEGTRDRPPTEEAPAAEAVPLDQNPLLEQRQGNVGTRSPGEIAEKGETEDDRVSLSPLLPFSLSLASLAAAEPWSRRVDDALAGADESAWQRLRRAGRRGRWRDVPKLATRPRMRAPVPLDYNR